MPAKLAFKAETADAAVQIEEFSPGLRWVSQFSANRYGRSGFAAGIEQATVSQHFLSLVKVNENECSFQISTKLQQHFAEIVTTRMKSKKTSALQLIKLRACSQFFARS